MREEVLELMETARQNPEAAGTPQEFHFKALQVRVIDMPCQQQEDLEVSFSDFAWLQESPGWHSGQFMRAKLFSLHRKA